MHDTDTHKLLDHNQINFMENKQTYEIDLVYTQIYNSGCKNETKEHSLVHLFECELNVPTIVWATRHKHNIEYKEPTIEYKTETIYVLADCEESAMSQASCSELLALVRNDPSFKDENVHDYVISAEQVPLMIRGWGKRVF